MKLYLFSLLVFFSLQVNASCLKEGSKLELQGHVHIEKTVPNVADEGAGDGAAATPHSYFIFKPEIKDLSICVIDYTGAESLLNEKIQLFFPKNDNDDLSENIDPSQLITVSGELLFADGSPSMMYPQLIDKFVITKGRNLK